MSTCEPTCETPSGWVCWWCSMVFQYRLNWYRSVKLSLSSLMPTLRFQMTVTLQQCQQNLVLESFWFCQKVFCLCIGLSWIERCNSATHKIHVAIYLCDPSEFNGSIKGSSRSDNQRITSSTKSDWQQWQMGLKTTENIYILNISKTNIKETSFDWHFCSVFGKTVWRSRWPRDTTNWT